jgi:hypothetical protein
MVEAKAAVWDTVQLHGDAIELGDGAVQHFDQTNHASVHVVPRIEQKRAERRVRRTCHKREA